MALRFVMLGDGGVGKSCLTVQFCHDFFTIDYDPTIENLYRKQLTVDDTTCMLEILDTAGQEDYSAMRHQHIRQGQAFGLVYSITSKQSFQLLGQLYNDILMVKEDKTDYPVVVFGNKVDLMENREVSTRDGQEFAKRIGAPFFEASAKTRFNVEAAFEELVRETWKWEKRHEGDTDTKKPTSGKSPRHKCLLM